VELVSTKKIEMFIPVMKDVAQEFGDRFLIGMLRGCEVGRRSGSNSSAPQEHGAFAILIIVSPHFEFLKNLRGF